MNILIFDSLLQAQAALECINVNLRQQMGIAGYTSDESGAIIARNAATGYADPAAARTTGWDTIHTAPDGRFYLFAPAEDSPLLQGVEASAQPMPADWIVTGE